MSGRSSPALSVRGVPPLSAGVVVKDARQTSKVPSRKSFSWAPISGEERVSTRKFVKHPSRPSSVRSTPPSIRAPAYSVSAGEPAILLWYGHGDLIVLL